jgi:hypothetical protein
MSSIDERNARLDDLVKATTTWASKRREELKARVEANKRILKGRTGSERLAQASVSAAQELVVDEIDAFLVT